MRSIVPVLGLVAALAITVAGCADSSRPSSPAVRAVPSASTIADATATPEDTDAPAPTAVPGGQTVEPGPVETHKPTTTKTDWGVILDSVPEDFPLPGREGGRLARRAGQRRVRGQGHRRRGRALVRKALEEAAWSTLDLSDPLEDGSRVLDSQGDLPECQVQTTFRPRGGSTLITVLLRGRLQLATDDGVVLRLDRIVEREDVTHRPSSGVYALGDRLGTGPGSGASDAIGTTPGSWRAPVRHRRVPRPVRRLLRSGSPAT